MTDPKISLENNQNELDTIDPALFTKDEFLKQWANLSSQDPNTNAYANLYILQFKRSKIAFSVGLELLNSVDLNSQLLGSIIIYDSVRIKAKTFIENASEYKEIYSVTFSNLLGKFKNSNSKITERICYTMSILFNIGLLNNWVSFNDLLSFFEQSEENKLIILLILSNAYKESQDLEGYDVSVKQIISMKEKLSEASDLIEQLIMTTLEKSIGNIALVKQALLLGSNWVRLSLNILEKEKLVSLLIHISETALIHNEITEDSMSLFGVIANMYIESIAYSKDARIYSVLEKYQIEELLGECNPIGLRSVVLIVESLHKLLEKANQLSKDQSERLVGHIANVFGTACEHYIFLMFCKDEPYARLYFSLLDFFLSSGNVLIAVKMHETINEMRDFICRGHMLYDFNETEKKQFIDYVFRLMTSVLRNCKLPNLNMRRKKASKGQSNQTVQEQIYIEDLFEFEDDDEMQLNKDYRRSSEDFFYNAFLLIITLLDSSGSKVFFDWVNGILSGCQIDQKSLPFESLVLAESVMLILKSILDTYEVTQLSILPLLQVLRQFINSQALLNDRVMYSFLVLLDMSSYYLYQDMQLCEEVMAFLLRIAQNKDFESVVCSIIKEIADYFRESSPKCFERLYGFYCESYLKLGLNSAFFLSSSLCSCYNWKESNLNLKDNSDLSRICEVYYSVLQPSLMSNQKVMEYLINCSGNVSAEAIKEVKMNIVKNFRCFSACLKSAHFVSSTVLAMLFKSLIDTEGKTIRFIYENFSDDYVVIKECTDLLIKIICNLQDGILPYFELINQLMISSYLSNPLNYKNLKALSCLYEDFACNDPGRKDVIVKSMLTITTHVVKSIVLLSENQAESVEFFAKTWSKITHYRVKVPLDRESMTLLLNFFVSVLKHANEISMTKSVLVFLNAMIDWDDFIEDAPFRYEVVCGLMREVVLVVFNFDSGSIKEVRGLICLVHLLL